AAEGESPEDLKDSSSYLDAAGNVIRRDPVGYVQRRVKELVQACIQPHGTVILGGESLKDLTRRWITDDHSPRGLWNLMQSDHFWPKLALYVFHFGGLILGALGAWRLRRAWPITLPLIGLIGYMLLMHLIMLALPRYIFPLYPVMWVLAAGVWIPRRAQ
ncbi:MAG: hypothetical protein HY866_21095, partial [Chloroflexi bacterium]|nr:hypothetical protein [Chloroflexota bacterium]